jgi:hypothetical protein
MRAFSFAIVAATFLLASLPAAAATRLIYRIDAASAVIVHRHLVIAARGAVLTGGWINPRLHLIKISVPEAKTLHVRFVARPPMRRGAVVQETLPIGARIVAPLPRYGAKQVKVQSETNSVVVPITR